MEQHTAEKALKELAPLVGEWTLEAIRPGGDRWPGRSADHDRVARLGCPPGPALGDGEWRLWRDGAPFPQRFTGRFEDDGNTIIGRWEKAEDGTTYETDFDLIYRSVK